MKKILLFSKKDSITLGDELLVNGDFINWTADNPDSWVLVGVEDGINYVTEVTGMLNLVSSGTTTIYPYQTRASSLTVGKEYKISVNIISSNSTLRIYDTYGNLPAGSFDNNGTGVFTTTFTAIDINLKIRIQGIGDSNHIIDYLSVKEIL